MSLAPPPKDPTFEAKREEWIRCLDGDDRNSVLRQVFDIVWNAGAYRVVLEARRIAPRDKEGVIKLNGLTHQLLDRCFYQAQLVSIRRLLDKKGPSGEKGVFSLLWLVKDLRKHRSLFTRRNLFAAFNICIDARALHAAEQEFLAASFKEDLGATTLPPDVDAFWSESLHDTIDQLSGRNPTSRREEDLIADSVFAFLESQLAKTETICEHVNKFIAHAATPESRAEVNADEAKITFEELWESHQIICRVCQFIDTCLLRQLDHSFLADASGDLFRYADQPLAPPERVGLLRNEWNQYAREVGSWSVGAVDWVLGPHSQGKEGERA